MEIKKEYTIIKEDYDKETFLTTVTIDTQLGQFTGYSKPYDTDCKYPSMFHGNQMAITKALHKFAQKAIKLINIELRLLESMTKEIKDYNSFEAKIIKYRYNHALDQRAEWGQLKKDVQKMFKDRDAARDIIVNRYQKKDEDKKDNLFNSFL